MAGELWIEQVVDNLCRLYSELNEASGEDGAEIDLDLLFLDVLRACGLLNYDNLSSVIGQENTLRVVEMVVLPDKIPLPKPEGPHE